jgi:hypothetical protein
MNNDPRPIVIEGAPQSNQRSRAEQTRDRLRARIEEYIAGGDSDLREAARALRVLPLEQIEEARWYGVRPNGDLIAFSPIAPGEPDVVVDEWKRAAALLWASKQYPELEALVPPPPLNSRPCGLCNGSGQLLIDNRQVVCVCEGLGWLSPISDAEERGGSDERHEPSPLQK